MSTSFLSDAAVGKLFAEKPPVLVEVRFPKMGTSPDWFLCEDAAALDAILDRLALGAEVHLSSVWDLKNPAGAVVIRKWKRAGAGREEGPGGASADAGLKAPCSPPAGLPRAETD
jgi:hypothetical protein